MVSRDNSPMSPMKKRNLGESNETDISSSKNNNSGFSGFKIKGTLDINTFNFGAEVTGKTEIIKKKDIIPANPILPKMVFNEMK